MRICMYSASSQRARPMLAVVISPGSPRYTTASNCSSKRTSRCAGAVERTWPKRVPFSSASDGFRHCVMSAWLADRGILVSGSIVKTDAMPGRSSCATNPRAHSSLALGTAFLRRRCCPP